MEKELNEIGKDLEVHIIPPLAQASANSVVKAMSRIILRDLEIVGLKNQNKNLENLALKREEERNPGRISVETFQKKMTSWWSR